MVSASHYRDLLQQERNAIAGLCEEWQSLFKDSDRASCIPDDVCGKIQIAIGQAHLLIEKKFKQFSGLILACEDGGMDKEVTVQDLQGFWEMMYIQVADIHKKFEEIEKLKANKWESLPTAHTNQRRPLGNLNKSVPSGTLHQKSSVSKDFSALAKERLAKAKALARKRMEEESCQ